MNKISYYLTTTAMTVMGACAVTPVLASGFSFTLGPTVYKETYEEFNEQDQKFMQQEATMVGLDTKLGYAFNDSFSVSAGYGFAWGDTKYTGSLQGGNYGDLVDTGMQRYRHQVNLDATYRADFGTGLTAGLGWRKLHDHMDAMPTGYRRTNEMLYAALGIDHAFRMNSWVITPSLTYKHLLEGRQFSGILDGVYNKQRSGRGYDVSVDFVYVRAGGSSLKIAPFLRTWDIDDSEKTPFIYGGYLTEPRNKTKEIGVNVQWTF